MAVVPSRFCEVGLRDLAMIAAIPSSAMSDLAVRKSELEQLPGCEQQRPERPVVEPARSEDMEQASEQRQMNGQRDQPPRHRAFLHHSQASRPVGQALF